MGIFEQTRELSRAISSLNCLIRQINASGGSVYLVDKNNPNFTVKLKNEVDVTYYKPINFGESTLIIYEESV